MFLYVEEEKKKNWKISSKKKRSPVHKIAEFCVCFYEYV